MEQQKRKSYWIDYQQSTTMFVFIRNFCEENDIQTGFEGPHLWITATDEASIALFQAIQKFDSSCNVKFFECKQN